MAAGCAGDRIAEATAADTGPGPIMVRADPVPLYPDETGPAVLGKLRYRGGLRLTALEPRFGGWSDLRIADDGRRVTMISDRGYWLDATLVIDATGRLTGLERARLGPLIDTRGRPVTGRFNDAEGLAARADGGYVISFEGQHRLWLYPAAEPPFTKAPTPLTTPPGATAQPANGGMEALASLASGDLLVLSEEMGTGDDHAGWIGDGQRWEKLTYRAASDYKPTAIAGLPNGDALVLERRFSLLGGFGGRLVRVRAADIAPGRLLKGQELARFESPATVDNFEGVAIARGPSGETLVVVVSDDNYQRLLQQTLLMMFELTE